MVKTNFNHDRAFLLNSAKTRHRFVLTYSDNTMLFPTSKPQAIAFFNLVDRLHEQASIIITTNKSPKEWAETLDDEVLATALLDRLLYRCEIIKLSGNSYRMENRSTIFSEKETEL